jgi:hypothetical protein
MTLGLKRRPVSIAIANALSEHGFLGLKDGHDEDLKITRH